MKLGSIQVREGARGKTYRAQIRMRGYKHMSKCKQQTKAY